MSNRNKKKVVATQSTLKSGSRSSRIAEPVEFTFGKQNYIWMGIGVALVALGMIMMLGGGMPSPDVWDDSIIYSFRITVIAPILILAGLGVEVYAIFKD